MCRRLEVIINRYRPFPVILGLQTFVEQSIPPVCNFKARRWFQSRCFSPTSTVTELHSNFTNKFHYFTLVFNLSISIYSLCFNRFILGMSFNPWRSLMYFVIQIIPVIRLILSMSLCLHLWKVDEQFIFTITHLRSH